MKAGDIVNGECKFCGHSNFMFMEERKPYFIGICLGCGWVQKLKLVD